MSNDTVKIAVKFAIAGFAIAIVSFVILIIGTFQMNIFNLPSSAIVRLQGFVEFVVPAIFIINHLRFLNGIHYWAIWVIIALLNALIYGVIGLFVGFLKTTTPIRND